MGGDGGSRGSDGGGRCAAARAAAAWPLNAGTPRPEQPQQTCSPPRRRHRVLMVSDFFYPNFGGVENHIYQLAQCLLAAGHKVVVMTHAYGECTGVRYLTNGLKVYYIPRRPVYAQSTLPTIAGAMRLLRTILLRERITLVHSHQAFSALGIEALVHARTMGYRTVFTDHSLFGFADAASIATNKILKAALSDADAVICVSHTSRENTVLRACLPPGRVSVIPNAVDASEFEPADEEEEEDGQQQQGKERQQQQQETDGTLKGRDRRSKGQRQSTTIGNQQLQQQPVVDAVAGDAGNGASGPRRSLRLRHQQQQHGRGPEALQEAKALQQRQEEAEEEQQGARQEEGGKVLPPLTVVALSRLVHRKGIDLLALVVPELCARHPNINFVIGGDGPKRRLLEEVVRRGGLEGRVTLLGAVPHERAREVLLRGQVFVNASLTEAFCMAIVEAASAGLLVVSTRVGGVPEVLPPDMLLLCEPSADGLLAALEQALSRDAAGRAPRAQHERVRRMYDWRDVAARTARVYDAAAAAPRAAAGVLLERLRRGARAGTWAGPLWCCVLVALHWWWRVLEWWEPAAGVEVAPDWPLKPWVGDGGSGSWDAGVEGSAGEEDGVGEEILAQGDEWAAAAEEQEALQAAEVRELQPEPSPPPRTRRAWLRRAAR